MFRGRHTFRKLRLLIDGLPGMGSRYHEARRGDPDLLALLATLTDDEGGRWRPQPTEWDLDRELLARINDRLGQVLTLLADLPTSVKRRQKPPPFFPRPLDPVARARAEAAQQRLAELEDDVAQAQARWLRMQAEQGVDPDGR